MHLSKSIIISVGISVLVLFVGLIYFLVLDRNISPTGISEDIDQETNLTIQNDESKNSPPINISEPSTFGKYRPGDWDVYWNDEWGIGFRYPYSWTLLEEERYFAPDEEGPNRKLNAVVIQGTDGCSMRIDKAGSGVPEKDWTHPDYSIGGYTPKTWEFVEGNKHTLILSMGGDVPADSRVIFKINATPGGKIICDQILSTVVFF